MTSSGFFEALEREKRGTPYRGSPKEKNLIKGVLRDLRALCLGHLLISEFVPLEGFCIYAQAAARVRALRVVSATHSKEPGT